ncbi:3-oxoacyl-[acyl-carrier-protein] reductase FabG [Eumeta japonica]|uniref:3-oxoacyl-[acyl-carrier-protein] reductase FabG n=1 Tax=Eumeta variegata TaxID=151549 RepID=A0A4C1XVK2_EUMVA|nr:3-oxoacyl-[acyl-carrier-protein] reductase FabG [Eumeta japonica]
MDFSEKVVIVTGASSGVGAACAILFAKHGAKLTVIGRNEERLGNVIKKCVENNNKVPLALILDLTLSGSCENAIKRTVEAYGRIDVLVNCAGTMTMSSLYDESPDAFDEMMNINLRVPYKLTQLAVPHLVKTKGNVVNLSTAMLNRVRPGFMLYAVAKAGLAKFTRVAGMELASEGVRVNAVSLGITRTNFMENLNMDKKASEAAYDRLKAELPTGNILEPEEAAKFIVIIASDMFPNLTGSILTMDGGFSLA